MDTSIRTHDMIKDIMKNNTEFTLTKIADMLRISRVTLNISLNKFRDTGKCVNPKCMLLFTEIINEKVSNALFLDLKIKRINNIYNTIDELHESIDQMKSGITPDNRALISHVVGMVSSLLNGDYDNKIIDDALRVIGYTGKRAFNGISIDPADVIGFQTITNKHTLNSFINKIEKLETEIKERDKMGEYANKYDGRYYKFDKSKYKVGQLVTGTIEDIRETNCVIATYAGMGTIDKKYILKSNYEGNLKVGAEVEVRIFSLSKKRTSFYDIHFL